MHPKSRTARRHVFERTFVLSLLCILVHDILQQSGRDLSLTHSGDLNHDQSQSGGETSDSLFQVSLRRFFPFLSLLVPLSLGLHLLLESVAGWHMFPIYLVLGSRTFLSPVALPNLLKAVLCWANILLVLLALLAGAVFPSPRLPRPSGPYDIGCVHYHWRQRPSRPREAPDGSTEDSVRRSRGIHHIKILYPINPRRQRRSLLRRFLDPWLDRDPHRRHQRHSDAVLRRQLPYMHQPCSTCHGEQRNGIHQVGPLPPQDPETPYRFARYCHEYLPSFLSRAFLHHHIQERAVSNAWPGKHVAMGVRDPSPLHGSSGARGKAPAKTGWKRFLPIFDSPPEIQEHLGKRSPFTGSGGGSSFRASSPAASQPKGSQQVFLESGLDSGALLSSQQLCYPVLLYCPDWDSQPGNHTFLCESWVSRGFVVCVLEAPPPISAGALSPQALIEERRACILEAIQSIKHLNEHTELPEELRSCQDPENPLPVCRHRQGGSGRRSCALASPGAALLDNVGNMMRRMGFRPGSQDAGPESDSITLSRDAAAAAAPEEASGDFAQTGESPNPGAPEAEQPQPRTRLAPPTLLAQCMSRLGMLHQLQLFRQAQQDFAAKQEQQTSRPRTSSRAGRAETGRQKSKRKKSAAAGTAPLHEPEPFDPDQFVQGFLSEEPMGGTCTCCFNMFFGRLNMNSGVGLIGMGAGALAALEISSVSQWFRDRTTFGAHGDYGRRSSVCEQQPGPGNGVAELAPEASCLPISCVVAVDPWIIPDSPMHHHVWQCRHTFPALFVCSEEWTRSHERSLEVSRDIEPEIEVRSGRVHLKQFCLQNSQPCYLVDYHGAKSLNFSDLPFLLRLNCFPRSFFSRIQSPDVQHTANGTVDVTKCLPAMGTAPPVTTIWSLASLTSRFIQLYHAGSPVHGYQRAPGDVATTVSSAWLPSWSGVPKTPPPSGFPSLRPFSHPSAEELDAPRHTPGGKRQKPRETKQNQKKRHQKDKKNMKIPTPPLPASTPPRAICVPSDALPPKELVQSAVMLLASNPLYSFTVYA